MIDGDAALTEVAPDPVGQAVPQVPADRQKDDVRREGDPANAE
jgi:hypothetical protein